jgi:hypothetical protein
VAGLTEFTLHPTALENYNREEKLKLLFWKRVRGMGA